MVHVPPPVQFVFVLHERHGSLLQALAGRFAGSTGKSGFEMPSVPRTRTMTHTSSAPRPVRLWTTCASRCDAPGMEMLSTTVFTVGEYSKQPLAGEETRVGSGR